MDTTPAPAREEAQWNSLSSYEQEATKVSSKKWLTKEELTELTRIKPWRWGTELALNWLFMIATLELALLAGRTLPWWGAALFDLGAFVFLGCLQNGMIQWRHEASHYNLSRDRERNDLLSDLFIAGPVGSTVGLYRYHHIPHHLYLNDPDREIQPATWICLRGAHLVKELLFELSGLWYLKGMRQMIGKPAGAGGEVLKKSSPKVTPAAAASFVIVNGALLTACTLQGGWWVYFLLWVLPQFTVAQIINNFRTILEHQPSSDICEVGRSMKLPAFTRVIRGNWLERWLIAPVGFYFHYEHHAWPSIPYHRLAETRALLTRKGFFEKEPMIYADGYLRSLWRLSFEKGWGLRLLNPLADLEKLEAELHAA